MHYIYVLFSSKLKKRYVGSTSNIKNRLLEHNKGKSRFTKGGIPWILVYQEEYVSLNEARKRESFLKSGAGRKFLDEIIKDKLSNDFIQT